MPRFERIGLVFNVRLPQAQALAEEVAHKIGGDEKAWIRSTQDLERMGPQHPGIDLLVTVGGDGTILRAARLTSPHAIPILGINMGRLGFMTELTARDAVEGIGRYLANEARIEERATLETSVASAGADAERRPSTLLALNEAVVGRSAASHMIWIEARLDGARLGVYRADAVLVATATGSTGYSLSAGGPVLHPEAQEMVLKPVAAYGGLSAALVLASTSQVELTNLSDFRAMLSLDGYIDLPVEPGETVVVQRGPHVARFLRAHPAAHYHATLLQRLGLEPEGGLPRGTF